MPELLAGAPGKRMRAECLPARVKKANMLPWTSRLSYGPFKAKTGVRIPLGVPLQIVRAHESYEVGS